MLGTNGMGENQAEASRERGRSIAPTRDAFEVRQVVEISDLAPENNRNDEGGPK
jgi:hypothetical protein